MAAATCFYHADQVASTVCSQCSLPLCSGCTETVAGKPVCRRCVENIRARVASQMNAPVDAAPPQTGPSAGFPLPPVNAAVPAAAAAPVPQTSAMGLLMGVLYGAIAGAAGAFVLAKVEGQFNFEWGYLNALVGFGVGYGVLMGDKRGGVAAAAIGGVLAFFAMMFCEYLRFGDIIAKMAVEQNISAPAIDAATFLDSLRHLDIIDWVCIAIGVYGGAKTPLRAGLPGAIRM